MGVFRAWVPNIAGLADSNAAYERAVALVTRGTGRAETTHFTAQRVTVAPKAKPAVVNRTTGVTFRTFMTGVIDTSRARFGALTPIPTGVSRFTWLMRKADVAHADQSCRTPVPAWFPIALGFFDATRIPTPERFFAVVAEFGRETLIDAEDDLAMFAEVKLAD